MLWRMNRRRLDAESIHDAVLCISGKLDPTMGGPSVKQFHDAPGHPRHAERGLRQFRRRSARRISAASVYRFLFRTLPDPFMEALDCPDGSQQFTRCGTRR